MKDLIFLFYVLSLLIILGSCTGTNEIINKSSRNLDKGEDMIIGTIGLNPTIMPLNTEGIDSIQRLSKRTYGFYQYPITPIFSVNYYYGVTDFYEFGGGIDGSIGGYALILNNKIGFADFGNKKEKRKFGLSYYNKSSFAQGIMMFGGSYLPFRLGHFESSNILLAGLFFGESEIIIAPHCDFNYLISKKKEKYYNTETHWYDNYPNTVVNNTFPFNNYGCNLTYRYKEYYFEIGIQYLHGSAEIWQPFGKNNYQYSIGVGWSTQSIGIREIFIPNP